MINLVFVYTNPLGIPYIDLGLSSLSAYLKKNNKNVKIKLLDFSFGLNNKKALKIIKQFNPDIICFTSRSNEFEKVVEKAKFLRKNHDVIYICGGIHPTIAPEDSLRSCFDGICRGEGELALNELINKIANNEDFYDTKNFWFRKKGVIIKNEYNKLIEDLNQLPIIDYELFDIEQYLSIRQGQIDYVSARGCPFQCRYCVNHKLMLEFKDLGRYTRTKSADTIIKELSSLKKRYKKIESIKIADELFVLDKKRLKELSKRYKKEINLPFECDVRADFCNEEVIKSLKEMGCEKLNIAIETGDEKMRFDLLGKKITNEQIITAFKLARKYGIRTMSLNMIGLPNESPLQIRKTIKLNQKAKPDSLQVSIFTPYFGTDLYEYVKSKNILKSKKLTDTYYSGDYLKNPYLTPMELERERIFFGYNYYKKFSISKALLILARDFSIPYYLELNKKLPNLIKKGIYYMFWKFKPLRFLAK